MPTLIHRLVVIERMESGQGRNHMADEERLAERIRGYFKRQKSVEEKRLFGGVCFMPNGPPPRLLKGIRWGFEEFGEAILVNGFFIRFFGRNPFLCEQILNRII